jgi:predicted DNA-binding ribbon-helix-helix protein
MNKEITVTIDPSHYGFGKNLGLSSSSKKNIKLILEDESWQAFDEICEREQSSIHAICTIVDMIKAPDQSLEMAVRLFIMDYFRCAATDDGHTKAGHGVIFHPNKPSNCLH